MSSTQLLMMGALGFTFFYFFIKPQRDEQRRHNQLIAGLEKGNRVATSGGLIGTVVRVEDGVVTLKVADRVEVQIRSEAILEEVIV